MTRGPAQAEPTLEVLPEHLARMVAVVRAVIEEMGMAKRGGETPADGSPKSRRRLGSSGFACAGLVGWSSPVPAAGGAGERVAVVGLLMVVVSAEAGELVEGGPAGVGPPCG